MILIFAHLRAFDIAISFDLAILLLLQQATFCGGNLSLSFLFIHYNGRWVLLLPLAPPLVSCRKSNASMRLWLQWSLLLASIRHKALIDGLLLLAKDVCFHLDGVLLLLRWKSIILIILVSGNFHWAGPLLQIVSADFKGSFGRVRDPDVLERHASCGLGRIDGVEFLGEWNLVWNEYLVPFQLLIVHGFFPHVLVRRRALLRVREGTTEWTGRLVTLSATASTDCMYHD